MPMLQRLTRIFSGGDRDPGIAALYRVCINQARQEEFYRSLGVPDTVDGRFDLLVLHAYLVMRRLGGESEARQQLFDLMFSDMDQSLREMGVGDMGISRRIKPMISAFYGRAQAYEAGLMSTDKTLDEALLRNVYGPKANPSAQAVKDMVAYVRRAASALDTQPVSDVLEGRAEFPAPVLN